MSHRGRVRAIVGMVLSLLALAGGISHGQSQQPTPRPWRVGTTLPGTCVVGDLFFKSNVTAGQNLYECGATNTWTQQLNSGAGGGVALGDSPTWTGVHSYTNMISFPAADTQNKPWSYHYIDYPNANCPSRNNDVFQWGYNRDVTGTRINTSDAAITWQLETHWCDPVFGPTLEHYITLTGSNGTTYRPFFVQWDKTTGSQTTPWQWGLTTGQGMAWYDQTLSTYWGQITQTGMDICDTCAFTKSNAGSNVLTQAGTSLIKKSATTSIGVHIAPDGGHITFGNNSGVNIQVQGNDKFELASLYGLNGTQTLGLNAVASAVNYLQAGNATTGNSPELTASGSDSIVDLTLRAKGSTGVFYVFAGVATGSRFYGPVVVGQRAHDPGTLADGTKDMLTVQNNTATTGVTRLVVRAGAGQSTTALQEWRNNSDTPLAAISATGGFSGGLTGATGLPLTTGVTGILPVANGGTNLTTATDDALMIGNGTTWQSKAVPDCTDTGGQHLNYTAATNTLSCGTSGGSGVALSDSPTWTGRHTFAPAAGTGTVAPAFTLTPANNTALTASTEHNTILVNTSTQQWATGALSVQNKIKILGNTLTAVGASTFSEAATLSVSGPIKGTNVSATQLEAVVIPTWNCSTATTCLGLAVNAPTGATNNYAATFTGGNVGIGTVSPAALLHVGSGTPTPFALGNVSISIPSASYLQIDDGSHMMYFGTDGSPFAIVATYSAFPLGFRTGNTERLRIGTDDTVIFGRADGTATLAGSTLRGPNYTGSNGDGVITTLQASLGTGTGARGTLVFSAAAAAQASGATQQTAVAHMTVGDGKIILNSGAVTPASTGTRYLCISTTGQLSSSASACSGT